MVIFHSYVSHYQRVNIHLPMAFLWVFYGFAYDFPIFLWIPIFIVTALEPEAYSHAKTGMSLVFPSWLVHGVAPHHGPRERVVFAYNLHTSPGSTLASWTRTTLWGKKRWEVTRGSGWWFGICIYFPIYWECHHPNWLLFFGGVETTNQGWVEGKKSEKHLH